MSVSKTENGAKPLNENRLIFDALFDELLAPTLAQVQTIQHNNRSSLPFPPSLSTTLGRCSSQPVELSAAKLPSSSKVKTKPLLNNPSLPVSNDVAVQILREAEIIYLDSLVIDVDIQGFCPLSSYCIISFF